MVEQKTSVAVLFADVSDSTRLYESLGDTTAFGKVRVILALLSGITEALHGRVVKTIGDGVMCVFPTADQAAVAAGEMQAAVARLPLLEGGRKLTIRIGYHFGQVIQAGEDVYGDSVNVAARMASLAAAGQVLTTGETGTSLSGVVRAWVHRLDALPVKGKGADIEVYEQSWEPNAVVTALAARARPTGPADPRLGLVYRGRALAFQSGLEFGREPADGGVVLDAPMISRRHARIERRGGKFVVADRSSNGTYVTLGLNPEVHLRREELVLYGAGVISFGQSASAPGAEVVEFLCS